MTRQVVCTVLVLGSVVLSPVSAFSAQLSRPWEPPSTVSTSLTRRRRRRYDDSALQSTSAPTQDKDSDDTTKDASNMKNNEEEDTMMLQKNDNSVPEVIIAEPQTNAMPVSSTESPKKQVELGATVRSSLRLLFGMTRPSNFPGVVLLHILGVYLALQSPYVGNAQLLPTLAQPSMMIVLFCLLLTSAASMVVNDYFDNQIGVDNDVHKPLVKGSVTMAVAKKFLYYIYAILALCMTVVPGVPARLMVVIGNMLTYWYTKHLKPITWLKNVVCASIMALSPATSGAAAFHLLSTQNSFRVFGVSALSRLVATLFLGFTGREIMMDINDVDDDMAHDVRTVPVAHGRKYAAKAALICTAAMAVCAMMGPIWQLAKSVGSNFSWKALLSTLRESPGGATRQLALASLGCLPMLRRAWNVFTTEGEDRAAVERAVDEGKLTFIFILASFV